MKLHELLSKIVFYAHVKLVISDTSEIICQKVSVMLSNSLYSDCKVIYVYPINNEYIGIIVKKGDQHD